MNNNNIIKCFCGMNAICLTSQKNNENQGRKFWKCSKRLDACRFFKWDDELSSSSTSISSSPSLYSSPKLAQHQRHSILSSSASSPNMMNMNANASVSRISSHSVISSSSSSSSSPQQPNRTFRPVVSPMSRSSSSSLNAPPPLLQQQQQSPSFFSKIYNSSTTTPSSTTVLSSSSSSFSPSIHNKTNNNNYNSNAVIQYGNSSGSTNDMSHNNNNNNNSGHNNESVPLCPKHSVPCVQRITRKDGPNKGRPFWTCPQEQNCHFAWADSIIVNNSGSGNGGGGNGDHNSRSNASVPVSGMTPPDLTVKFELCSKSYATVIDNNDNDFDGDGEESEEKVNSKKRNDNDGEYGDYDDENDENGGKSGTKRDNEEKMEKMEENNVNNQKTIDFSGGGTSSSELYVLASLPEKNKPLRYAISCLFEKNMKEVNGTFIKRNEKQWMFPYAYRNTVKNLIRSMPNTRIYIQDIPDSVVSFVQPYEPVNTKDPSGIDWNRFPESLLKAWRPFQREGITFGIKREGRCLIGDEMGLGKTIQAMSIAYYFKENWPLLIICPATLRYNWSNELERWLGIYPEQINVVTSSHIKPDNLINIISYELATKNTEDLLKRNFKCTIVDESHNLKNQRTERVRNIRPLLKNAERVILITGTPALSRPVELYPQIDLVMQGKWWLSYDDFSKRYCEAKETAFGIDRRGSSNLTELNYLLSRTVMIRRRKNDVLTELPTKIRQYIHLCVEDKDLKSLKSSSSERKAMAKEMMMAKSVEEHEEKQRGKNFKWLEMFRKTGMAKRKAVRAYVTDLLDKGVKFLIFGFHLKVLDEIEDVVKKNKVKYIRIDGSTAQGKRQKMVDEFRHNSEFRVAILSITAAGVGLTFTPCSTAIFAELYWTPGTLLQAEDRVHRIGQTTTVTIQYLLAKGTLDDELWPLIQKKIEILGETLDAKNEVNQWDDSEYSKYEGMDQTMKDEDDEARNNRTNKYKFELGLDDIENMDAAEELESSRAPGFFDEENADDDEIVIEEDGGDFDLHQEQQMADNVHVEEQLPTRITESPQMAKRAERPQTPQTKAKSKPVTTVRKTSDNLAEFFFQGNTDIAEVAKTKYGRKSDYVFKRSFFSSSNDNTDDSNGVSDKLQPIGRKPRDADSSMTSESKKLSSGSTGTIGSGSNRLNKNVLPVAKDTTTKNRRQLKEDDDDDDEERSNGNNDNNDSDHNEQNEPSEEEYDSGKRKLRPRKPSTLKSPFTGLFDSDDDEEKREESDEDVTSVFKVAEQRKKDKTSTATKPVLPNPVTPKLPPRTKSVVPPVSQQNPQTPKRNIKETTHDPAVKSVPASPFAQFMYSPSQQSPIAARKLHSSQSTTTMASPLRSTPRNLFSSPVRNTLLGKRDRLGSQEQQQPQSKAEEDDGDIEIRPGQEFDDIDFDAVLDACNLSQMPEGDEARKQKKQRLSDHETSAAANQEDREPSPPPVKFFFGL